MSLLAPDHMPDHLGYGSIFRMRPKPGCEGALRQHLRYWWRAREPKVDGFVASFLLSPDTTPGEMWGVAVFDNEECYRKVGADPEQDHWYRQLRGLLLEDPEWHDGHYEGHGVA